MPDRGSDDRLLAELAAALDPRQQVPPEVVAAGKAAFAWRDIDAELAELTLDAQVALAFRANPASLRAMTYVAAGLTIELELTEDALLGQLVPGQLAEVEVRLPGGAGPLVATDEVGCFTIRPLPRFPFHLRCRTAGGTKVATGWILG